MIDFSNNPFQASGSWLRGNTHTHTTLSDGHVEPQERITQYVDKGYDFLAITDHWKEFNPKDYSNDNITLIPAVEFHPEHATSTSGAWHFIALGIKPNSIELNNNTSAQIQVNAYKKEGAYMILCHPYWCGFSKEELKIIKNIDGFEVYNSVCEKLNGKGDSTNEYDSMLMRGDEYDPIASDDCHGYDECFEGWIMVKAPENNVECVMDSIKAGQFYASCGPVFENIELKNGIISVQCSDVHKITFISRAQSGLQVKASESEFINSAEAEIKKFNKFIRIQIEDKSGKKAWSPVYRIE